VFNTIDLSCALKSSFRSGFYSVKGYTSGFAKPKCKHELFNCESAFLLLILSSSLDSITKDDSYIKVSRSLGLMNLNLSSIFYNISADHTSFVIRNEMIELIERELYLMWKKHLLSNLQDIELYDLSLNITSANNYSMNKEDESILTVTYLIKLDPRIHENTPIIYKLISTINSTLNNPHKNVYLDLASMLPHDTSKLPVAIVLPTTQISRNSIYYPRF
jgi:hypothetical protein